MRFVAVLLSMFVVPAITTQGTRPKPPSQVKIGAYTYKIIYKHHNGQVGAIYFDEGEIHLEPGQPLDRERETVLHEIFHGCAYYFSRVHDYYHDDKEKPTTLSEDQFIEAVAPTFSLVLRENPDLVEYLADVQITRPSSVLQP